MKIRNGFVSNSSTSSFIIIVKVEDFNKLLTEIDPYQKAVLLELGYTERNVLGIAAVVISGMAGNYSSFEGMDVARELYDEKFEYDCYPSEAFYNIKWPETTYRHTTDC